MAEREDASDVEKMIDRTGCAREYRALEECRGENTRDWRKCQAEVRAIQKCVEAHRAAERAGEAGR